MSEPEATVTPPPIFNPAFPTGANETPGIFIRDYFAAHVVMGMIAASTAWRSWTNEEITQKAYEIADAMVAQRAKPISVPTSEAPTQT